MDATPFNPGLFGAEGGLPADVGEALLERGPADDIAARWTALHNAGAAACAIAGLAQEAPRPELLSFPAAIARAGGWRRERAEQGIEDIAAIMEPGLSALLSAHAGGRTPTVAALALWREFAAARDALLMLVPPPREG